jgi:hypothetical protein
LEEFLAYKNTGISNLPVRGKFVPELNTYRVMGDLTLGELNRDVVKKYVTRMQICPVIVFNVENTRFPRLKSLLK